MSVSRTSLRSRLALSTRLFVAGLALPLASAACSDDTYVIEECYGELLIRVPLATTPTKLRVELRRPDRPGVVGVTDECSSQPGWLVLEREPGYLIVDDGSIGYTPPRRFDLKITDLGTCDGTTATVVDVADIDAGPHQGLCDRAEVTLPAAN